MSLLGRLEVRTDVLVKVRPDAIGAHQRSMLIGGNAGIAINATVVEFDGERSRCGVVFHCRDAVGLDRGQIATFLRKSALTCTLNAVSQQSVRAKEALTCNGVGVRFRH